MAHLAGQLGEEVGSIVTGFDSGDGLRTRFDTSAEELRGVTGRAESWIFVMLDGREGRPRSVAGDWELALILKNRGC